MSEKQHTPGPWEAYHGLGAGWAVRRQHELPGYTSKIPICSLAWWQFDIPKIIDNDISEANARLIAAAPDLLEACEDLLGGLKYIREAYGDLYGVGWDRAQKLAETAIAKAKGTAE